jgi:hypothetical protein
VSADHHTHLPHFEIPRLRDLARHALPHVLEGTIIPFAVFYLALWEWGTMVGIVAALAWSWAALGYRVVRRRSVSGLLLIGIAGFTARSLIGLASGSAFVYFLQPSLATACVGAAFLFSIPAGRPLAERLARDFVPFPPGYLKRPVIRRVFMQITAIWALVMLLNAFGSVGLLLTQPIATYLPARTAASGLLTVGGVLASLWWFKRALRKHEAAARALPAA